MDKALSKVIKVDEAKRPIVEDIFRLAAKGLQLRKISGTIEEKYGAKLAAGRIQQMIKNKFYIGVVAYGDVQSQNDDFAITNKVVFGRAQKAMSRNQHNRSKTGLKD